MIERFSLDKKKKLGSDSISIFLHQKLGLMCKTIYSNYLWMGWIWGVVLSKSRDWVSLYLTKKIQVLLNFPWVLWTVSILSVLLEKQDEHVDLLFKVSSLMPFFMKWAVKFGNKPIWNVTSITVEF